MRSLRSGLTASLALAALSIFLIPSIFSQSEQKGGALAPLNPDYLRYKRDLAEGKVERVTPSGHGLGYVPTMVNLSHLRPSGPSVALAFPATYDLRTLGRLTPIRDQGQCGSCWTFATMASIESRLMPGEPNDFSENNLKNLHGWDSSPCAGGNMLKATAYLGRWAGPVLEKDDAYHPTDANTSPTSTLPAKHIQDVSLISPRTSSTDNDRIKQSVMDYGATFIQMQWEDAYFNSSNNSYNYTGTKCCNHAVNVVGWDDNFDRNRFLSPPSGNGAFIIRNSWGTGWADKGYFYVSYYDTAAGAQQYAAVPYYGVELTSNWSRIYQYDDLGWVTSYGYGNDTGWFANIFTAKAAELVGAVSFYTGAANSAYTVRVYTGVQGTPANGTLAGTTNGTVATAGYHTIQLSNRVAVNAGSNFSVVVRLQTPGYSYPIPIEHAVPNESSRATAHSGESFLSRDGSSWSDATSVVDATTNVCLKAFTLTSSTTTAPVTVTTNPAGQEISGDGTSYASPHTFTWNVGSSHTISVPSTQGSGGTRYLFANWSDSGAASHQITVASSAATYTANLTTQFLLTTNVSPAGAGSVGASPSSSDGYYGSGTQVQLNAYAGSGKSFNNWSGDASGSTTPVSVTMGAARTVTANFRAVTSTTITTNPPGLMILVDNTSYTAPQSFNWTASTTHSVSVASTQGSSGMRYLYVNWSDGGGQTHNITAPAAGGTYTANFTTQYQLTTNVAPAGAGTINAAPSSTDGYYNANQSVSLTAQAAGGYSFTLWSGSLSGTVNPQSVTMSGARTVTATFGAVTSGIVNDEAATATLITSLPYGKTQATLGATSNSSDPVHSCTAGKDARTVWYRYTSSFTGVLRIDTFGSDYDTVLSVYVGTATAASEKACNDDANEYNVTSSVAVPVTGGQVLLIEVSSYGSTGAGGAMVLNVRGQASAAAGNDEVATATQIATLPSNVVEDTSTATSNVSDPVHSCTSGGGGHSVWFRFVANYTGYLRVNTIGSDYDTVLSAYDGTAAAANQVACNDDIDDSTRESEIVFQVLNGHVYLIEVNAWSSTLAGTLILNAMSRGVQVSNDDISGALMVTALPYNIKEDIVAATQNVSDPHHACEWDYPDLRTVWFRYTSTYTGTLQVDTYGSDYDTVLTAYPYGNTSNTLACSDDANDATLQSAISIGVTAGQTYLIEVSEYDDGSSGTGGMLALNINGGSGGTSLTNDEPAGAALIPALPYITTVSTVSATSGSGDPLHSCTGKSDSASVWFRYVATFSGPLNVNANGSDYYTVLTAYPGVTSPGAQLACSAGWTSSPRSAISFQVVQGQSYLIEASGWNMSGGGTLVLNALGAAVNSVRDFRGIERSDALIYDPVSGTTYTALSNGNGAYSYVGQLFTPGFDILRSGDYNGDNKHDMVVYNSHNARAYIGMSNGDGTFAFQSLFWSPAYDFVEPGDLNGDGKTDFALYNSSTGTMYTGISNGDGTFTYKYTLITKGYTFLRLADFTGDNKADIFVYNASNGASWLGIGDGAGEFSFHALFVSPGYNLADVGDLNADGKADVMLYNSTNGNAATGLSDGGGGLNFTPMLFSPGFTSVRVADYTGDGKADVTVYNKNNGAAYFGTGTGTGIFNFQSLFWSPAYDVVEPQDINGNGMIDVVLYNSTTGTQYTGVSNANGTFTYTYALWGPGKMLAR